ncbi:unnamed protein product [Lactuca saligna]|uniref:Uncharacterized protein n=1 Tax=Lactuca saligna TaxID=75948 RepID=A0AA36E3F7_LACSI|nr:unnamed protein product [Lactuca saligna]
MNLSSQAVDYLAKRFCTILIVNLGLDYIRNTIQSSMDKRLTMWENYCFLRLSVVPEGFSLPKDDEESGSDVMDVDAVSNPDLDAHLDSLRTKLTLAEQESVQLKREIQALERQSAINNHQAALISELTKLSENDAFQCPCFFCKLSQLQKLAIELRMKVEKLKTEKEDESEHQKVRLWNEDLLRIIGGNGLSNADSQEIEGFLPGKMANIALEAEVEDVNSDLKVLNGNKLKLTIHHSNSSSIVYC